jgi:hypothetical protein
MPGVDTASESLENTYILNIEGVQETLSFDCENAPSVYASGVSNDQTTNKFIFDQGYSFIPISSERELIYTTIIYTNTDIRTLDSEGLKLLIADNPDIINFEISFKEEGKLFKNQFYGLSGFNPQYEQRNIVAENEVISFEIGNTNTFECMDNNETIEIDVEYSAIIKTEDELSQRNISLDLKIHLGLWK